MQGLLVQTAVLLMLVPPRQGRQQQGLQVRARQEPPERLEGLVLLDAVQPQPQWMRRDLRKQPVWQERLASLVQRVLLACQLQPPQLMIPVPAVLALLAFPLMR